MSTSQQTTGAYEPRPGLTWTFFGRNGGGDPPLHRWTLDADPRYAVERRGPGDYAMFIDRNEVDSADSSEHACARLAASFEYEEHASDLELARLRLRQAQERIVSRFPTAARDAQLSSILWGLADALGVGPEANLPDDEAKRATDRFRQQISPDFWIVVDASATVVFEVTTPAGRVLRRVAVSPTTVALVLGDAAMCARMVNEDADAARLRGPDEKRRASGKLTQREAVEWLIRTGPVSRQRAVHMVRALSGGAVGGPLTLGMTYDGTYWVVPAEQG